MLDLLEPTKDEFMISKIISRAACLTELTSNPKSFFNCPDLHGGSGACPKVDSDLEEFVFLNRPAPQGNDRGVTASYPPR
jgi:hypothetical protein